MKRFPQRPAQLASFETLAGVLGVLGVRGGSSDHRGKWQFPNFREGGAWEGGVSFFDFLGGAAVLFFGWGMGGAGNSFLLGWGITTIGKIVFLKGPGVGFVRDPLNWEERFSPKMAFLSKPPKRGTQLVDAVVTG